jgi:hypothetical protein
MTASREVQPDRQAPVIENGRIFLDLASQGCGVGCRYCYIAEPAAGVRPLPVAQIRATLVQLMEVLGSARPESPPLLTIGADTEVSAHPDIVRNAEECLAFGAEHQLPAQLATKFPLPPSLLSCLNSWPAQAPTPVVFTTITTVTRFRELEPGAPPPIVRADNFSLPRQRWLSYALVKPFHSASARDSDELLDLFLRKRPDGVVVGAHYQHEPAGARQNGDRYGHPFATGWSSYGLTEQGRAFANKLHESGLRRFLNTRCVTAWHNASNHGRLIKEQFSPLCVSCGAC